MEVLAGLPRDDDAPPPSGVRPRLLAPLVLLPAPAVRAAEPSDSDVLVEVGEEVFFEVWGVVRVLSPLQGAWLNLGPSQLVTAALTAAHWRGEPGDRPAKVLRKRWPELVPGHASMDRLAHLMVDLICR